MAPWEIGCVTFNRSARGIVLFCSVRPRLPYRQRFLLPFPTHACLHLVRDTLVLPISESQVHVLQTLCGRALEQVVNGSIDDDAFARAVDSEAADLDTVLARDVLDQGRFTDNLDEFLAGVAVLVDVADVAGGHCAVEGDGDGVLFGISLFQKSRFGLSG